MTTQHSTDASLTQHFEILWNDDGRHVSRLTYTDDQIEDINEIVYTVVRGILDPDRFDISVTYESGIA